MQGGQRFMAHVANRVWPNLCTFFSHKNPVRTFFYFATSTASPKRSTESHNAVVNLINKKYVLCYEYMLCYTFADRQCRTYMQEMIHFFVLWQNKSNNWLYVYYTYTTTTARHYTRSEFERQPGKFMKLGTLSKGIFTARNNMWSKIVWSLKLFATLWFVQNLILLL